MAEGRRGLRKREDFEARWRQDMAFAEQALMERGTLSGLFVVHGRNGLATPIVGTWSDQDEMEAVYEFVRLACLAHDAVGLAFMTEAWFVDRPDPSETSASKSSRRQECAFVIMVGRLADTGEDVRLLSARRIDRSEDGKVHGLTEMNVPESDIPGFNFVWKALEMIPTCTPPGDVRRRAREVMQRMQKRIRRGKRTTEH